MSPQFLRSLVALSLSFSVLAAGCGGSGPEGSPDAGEPCPTALCNGVCCKPGEVCTEGQCQPPCIPDCAQRDKQCGDDGCGGSCGTCPEAHDCNPATFRCECIAESDAQFCARLNANCGALTAPDNCGDTRTASCGSCELPDTCDPETHRCKECEAESDEELCSAAQWTCGGPLQVRDRCNVERTVPSCGDCDPGDHCVEHSCELCIDETDEEFCAKYLVECGEVTGETQCHNAHTVAECGPCAQGLVCDQRLCVDPTANDECAGARALGFDETGRAVARGDTTAATDSGATDACSGSSGKDVVYFFELTEVQNVFAALTFTPAGENTRFDAVISLRTACEAKEAELGCSRARQEADKPNEPATLDLRALPPGVYYLWVDSYYQSGTKGGPFTLEVQLEDPAPAPDYDTCAGAKRLTFEEGIASITDDTGGGAHDYSGSCIARSAPMTGPDLVYAFELITPSVVNIRLVRDETASPQWQPALYLRTTCESAALEDELGCARATEGIADLSTGMLPPATYHVVVDGLSGSHGPFTLTVTTQEPEANDRCAGAAPIALQHGVAVALTGNTTFALDDYSGTCGGSGARLLGPDLVYSFELQEAATVIARVIRSEETPAWLPAAYIRTACESEAAEDEKACTSSSLLGVLALAADLGPGAYYLVIDGANAAPGAFELELLARPPAHNDTCENAEPLAFDESGVARVRSTCAFATHDHHSYSSGADVVFSFTTLAPKALEMTLETAPSYPQAVLYARKDCAVANSRIAPEDMSAPYLISVPRIEPGTYYVWVDTAGTGAVTSFDLQVKLTDVDAPENDTCARPGWLNLDPETGVASVLGDTTLAGNDYSGICGTGVSMNGGDVAHAFRVTTESSLMVTLELTEPAAEPKYAGYVYLRRECDSSLIDNELLCVRLDGKNSATGGLSLVPPGVYYLIVDGVYASSFTGVGPYRLTVTATPRLANDSCSAPEWLDVRTGTVTVYSDTTRAASDTNAYGPCNGGNDATEKDLVYWFTLEARKAVTARVKLAEGSSLRPIVSLRRGECADPNAQVACARHESGFGDTVLTRTSLAPGVYYLWVDGYAKTSGAFELTVTVSDPPQPAPANDICAGAEPLAWDAATGTWKAAGSTAYAVHDYEGSCGGGGWSFLGPDVVYTFSLETRSAVVLTVTPDEQSKDLRAGLYLRTACSALPEDEVACKTQLTGGATTKIDQILPAGPYYLFVDGMNGSFGSFQVELSAQPAAANDTCASPQILSFEEGTSTLKVTGDTSIAADDGSGTSCGSYTGAGYKDVVYALRLDKDSAVSLKVGPTEGSKFRPVTYVRRTCTSQASQLQDSCKSASGSTQTVQVDLPFVTAGTWYVFVDSNAQSSFGPFELEVTLGELGSEVAANDLCGGAQRLTFLNDRATGSGNTTYAHDDYAGFCSSASARHDGRDVVYTFDLDLPSALKISLSSPKGIKPALYLRRACDTSNPDQEVACTSSTSVAGISQYLPAVERGTYFLVVDGVEGSFGSFNLTLTTAPPAANDTCDSPLPIPIDPVSGVGSVTGDSSKLLSGSDDKGVYYASSSKNCTTLAEGSELVYFFTLEGDRKVEVKLDAAGGSMKPTVYVRSACGDPNSELVGGCAAAGAGAAATATMARLPAGTYYVFADAPSNGEGPFTLTVTTTASPAPPTNDDCTAPQDLGPLFQQVDASTQRATVTAIDLSTAKDDGTGTFALGDYAKYPVGANGPDVVYRITTQAEHQLSATLTRKAADLIEPVLYLRTVCDSGDPAHELISAWREEGSDPNRTFALARVNRLPPGTYYLWVDSRYDSGLLDLEVTLGPPLLTGPANENCASAAPLVFEDNVAIVTGTVENAQNDSCADPTGGFGMFGPDVVYTFEAQTTATIQVKIEPLTGTYPPAMYLRRDCADRSASNKVASERGSAGQVLTTTVSNVAPGRFYLWVDTMNVPPTPGPFKLTVTLNPQ